jgi:hypothetical protein
MPKTIKLSDQNINNLNTLRAIGQSYNGIIEELIALAFDAKLNKKVTVTLDR